MRNRFRWSPASGDRVLAVAVLVVGQLEIWLTGDASGHRVACAVVSPIMASALALRRRYPLAAAVAGHTATALAFWLWGGSQIIASSVAWFCVLYGLAVWTTRRRFILGAAYVTILNLAPLSGNIAKTGSSTLFGVITLIVMLLIRRVLGDRERRLELAERERDVAAREAVVAERARIARELHDAIAHNVSMMVVQAGAERRVLNEEQSSTREVLETVEEIGRGALTEMRRLVGMLRSDETDPLTPQPGLDDLPQLVSQVREAGLPVELSVEGDPRELPVGLELSAFRIVQEALTNALKHAGDAHATVRVRYGPHSLELEIVDDGAGAEARADGGGHGLVGMRERVALYGGRFEADRRAAGGFTVRALLPIR
ncbi:MAG TPA: sensor histidine kinase [Gaiellaceae bacterium]